MLGCQRRLEWTKLEHLSSLPVMPYTWKNWSRVVANEDRTNPPSKNADYVQSHNVPFDVGWKPTTVLFHTVTFGHIRVRCAMSCSLTSNSSMAREIWSEKDDYVATFDDWLDMQINIIN